MQTLAQKRQYNVGYMSQKRQAWAAAGLCNKCGGSTDRPGKACATCLKNQREYHAQRARNAAANGCCYRCNATLPDYVNREAQYTNCPKCFFKHIANLHLGSRTFGESLAGIFDKQQGKCIYTDERLILGKNASLDHTLPKARGGTNDIANLQWVTKTVNDIKRDLTHDEFVAICRVIARRADGAT